MSRHGVQVIGILAFVNYLHVEIYSSDYARYIIINMVFF